MESKNIGLILSFVGGIVSFGLYFLIPFIFLDYVEYPNLYKIASFIGLILQIMCIIGGIIIIIGAFISIAKEEIGWKVILIGGLIGGVNILSIIGAIMLRTTEAKVEIDDEKFPRYIASQNEELNKIDEKQFIDWRDKKQKEMDLGNSSNQNADFEIS